MPLVTQHLRSHELCILARATVGPVEDIALNDFLVAGKVPEKDAGGAGVTSTAVQNGLFFQVFGVFGQTEIGRGRDKVFGRPLGGPPHALQPEAIAEAAPLRRDPDYASPLLQIALRVISFIEAICPTGRRLGVIKVKPHTTHPQVYGLVTQIEQCRGGHDFLPPRAPVTRRPVTSLI